MALKIKIEYPKFLVLFLIMLGTLQLYSQSNTEFATYTEEKPIELNKPILKKEANTTHEKPKYKRDNAERNKDTITPKEKTLIYLEQTDIIKFDQDILPDIQVLVGNVILRHDNAYLYCDSAYLNQNTNSFKAFGHVKIDYNDSVTIYSKVLDYNGNTRIAIARYNVKMINGEVTLTTDSMIYNRNSSIGYYTCGGTLQDSVNTLVSKKGYYHTNSKLAEFKTDVVGTNENNKIESDTLTYNTETKIATIIGPTTITHSDSTTIYSELGWYNSNTDESELLKNSIITHSEGKTLVGDTITIEPKDSSTNIINIIDNSIIIQQFDTLHYNQMSGKDMVGYILDRQLNVLEIKGNSESIFFPDDGGTLIGLNTIKSSYMTIYFKNGKLDRLNVFPSPTAVLYPMEKVTDNMLYLPNFTWQEDARPISKEDIFRKPVRISKKEIEEKKQAIKNQEKEDRKQQRMKKTIAE